MSYLPSDPDLSSIGELLAKYPRRGVLLFKLLEDNQSNGSALSKELREMLAAYVANLGQSNFDPIAEGRLQPEISLEPTINEQPVTTKKSAHSTRNILPVLQFLKKLTLTPEQISQDDVSPIFAAGWNERDFLDLVCLCSVVNCINRLAVGVGLDRKSDFSQRIFSKSSPRQPQEPANKKLIFNH